MFVVLSVALSKMYSVMSVPKEALWDEILKCTHLFHVINVTIMEVIHIAISMLILFLKCHVL